MGWFTDKYCSTDYYVIKSIRDKYCSEWDKKHSKSSDSDSDSDSDEDKSSHSPSSSTSDSSSNSGSSSGSSSSIPAQAPVVAAPTSPAPSAPAAPAQPRQVSSSPQPTTPAQRPTTSGQPSSGGASNNGNGNGNSNGLQNREAMPTSSVGTPVGNPFPTDHNTNGSGYSEVGASTATGLSAAVVCGIVASALLVVALFLFVGVRVVRNRRRKQVEDATYSNMGAAGAAGGAAGATTFGTASAMTQVPPMAYAAGDRGMAMEAGEIRTAEHTATVLPAPVFETLDIGPPLPGSQPGSDDFLFDAADDMHAAGLDRTVSPALSSPTGVSGAAGMAGIMISAAAGAAMSGSAEATTTNSTTTYTAGHKTINTSYAQETGFSNEVTVTTLTGRSGTVEGSSLHDNNDNAVPEDAFGEPIYGDSTLGSMGAAGVSAMSVQNTLQAMESEGPRAGITSSGYCPESLRADTYLELHTSSNNQVMVGTYGSDAVYLDAPEEFPDVPTMSPSDTRLRMI